jgi:hypothetical protein
MLRCAHAAARGRHVFRAPIAHTVRTRTHRTRTEACEIAVSGARV